MRGETQRRGMPAMIVPLSSRGRLRYHIRSAIERGGEAVTSAWMPAPSTPLAWAAEAIPLRSRAIIGLVALLRSPLAPANEAGGGTRGPEVTVVQHGDDVTVGNGIVQATIHAPSATITALTYKGGG